MTGLSREQSAIWKRRREGRRFVRNIPVAARLAGLIDSDVLAAALRDVIGRHEILRTTFPEDEGTPRQEVLDMASIPAASELLEIHPADERQVARLFNAAVDYGFDPAHEAPMRAHLFPASQGLHTLLMVFHPLAFDGGSISPLMRDLLEFYSARIEKREPVLPPLPMQYADYARKSTGDASNRPCPEDRRPVSGQPVLLDSDVPESRGIVPIRINPGRHRVLMDFAAETGISAASMLHTGFAVLCAHLELGDRVILDVMDTVRDRKPDTASMVGRFETILPLEISTSDNPTFREVVKRAAKAWAEGCAVLTTEVVVSEEPPRRFRTLFRMRSASIETFTFPMLKVYVNPVPTTETGFELVFDLTERLSPDGEPQGIEGSVIFDRNVFAPRHMPVRIDWMMHLLNHGTRNPDVRIHDLSPEEKTTMWARATLAPECSASTPERVPLTRVATVQDNGRSERVPLADSFMASSMVAAPAWQQSHVAFQDAVQCRLAMTWEEALGVSRVGARDRFADLGGDAIKARRVVTTVNRVFRRNLPVSLMCGGVTVESLASAICREQPFEPVSTIQPEEPGMKPPLFFVHGDVFGGGLYAIELSRYLGSDRPFLAFNPHGLNGLDVPESIEEMAEDYLNILRQMRPSGSFCLGGFCNGALIAYEMARMLEREGQRLETPVLLVESPPGDISEEPVAGQKSRPAKMPAAPPGSQTHRAWVLNEFFRLSGSYRPGKYSGPVVLIQSEESFLGGELISSVWKKVADNLHVYAAPGDHITCIGRHAPELADILRGVMDTDVSLMKRKRK
jgi:hypothetical protein